MPCFFVICSVIVEIAYPFDKDNRYGTTLPESRVSTIKGITGINVQVAKKNSFLPNISVVLRLALKKQSVPFAAVSTAVYANAPYEGLSVGAIAGIVVGSVAFVSLGCFALRWFVIKKKSFADLLAVFKKKIIKLKNGGFCYEKENFKSWYGNRIDYLCVCNAFRMRKKTEGQRDNPDD